MSKTIDVEGGTVGSTPPFRPQPTPSCHKAKLPPLASLAAVLFALLVMLGVGLGASGKLGIVNVDNQDVAVVVNYVTGSHKIVNTPGYQIYIPFLHEVFTFDKRVQAFVMQGQKLVSANHVPLLTVREKKGSNLRIDDLRIQYEIIPSAADLVLHDSGPGDAFKEEWIRGHARSILRDEFGKFDAIEAADPTIYKQASEEAKIRLNELLEPHGVRVMDIITPNPRFDESYEDAIEKRKEADQEVERLVVQLERLKSEQLRRLAVVEREKSVEMEKLEGELIKAMQAAYERATKIKGEADAYAIERLAQAEGMQSQLLQQARGLEETYRKEAEGIQARAQALEQRGEVVVREAIIEKLLGIQFTLMPYSRDPNPTRLEHTDATAHGTLVDTSMTKGGN